MPVIPDSDRDSRVEGRGNGAYSQCLCVVDMPTSPDSWVVVCDGGTDEMTG